jgi:hypothetical protein
VRVTNPVRVRSEPGTATGSDTVIRTAQIGEEFEVRQDAAPVVADGYTWVPVVVDEKSAWIAEEGFLEAVNGWLSVPIGQDEIDAVYTSELPDGAATIAARNNDLYAVDQAGNDVAYWFWGATTGAGEWIPVTGDTRLRYHVAIPDANEKRVYVTGTITGLDVSSLVLARPFAWAPTLPAIENLSVVDDTGTLLADDYRSVGSAGDVGYQRYTIAGTENLLTIYFAYTVSMEPSVGDYGYGAAAYWYFEPGEYMVVESQFLFLQPLSVPLAKLTMTFDLPPDWIPVSRLFPRADYYEYDVSDTVIYNQTQTFYLWGPIGLGQFDVYTDTVGGVEFVVAVPPDNAALGSQIAATRFAANRYISQHLWPLGSGETPVRYINIYPGPIAGYAMSSRDHCHGDFRVVYDQNWLADRHRELTHVTFHEWFLHGQLEYPQWDVIHPAGWAEEGLIDYFGVRVALESGNWSAERANAEWRQMYENYATMILNTDYDVPLTGQFYMFPDDIRGYLWYHKGALVNYLLNYQVERLTGGQKSIEDVFRFLHDQVPNSEGHPLDVNEFVFAYNMVTGHDFSSFFAAYVKGIVPLPFIVDGNVFQVDETLLPETPRLEAQIIAQMALEYGLTGDDSDQDGLLDWVEQALGTRPDMADTDGDGLDDGVEFGAIADGRPGELPADFVPAISDPPGDSLADAAGTDITGLYATGFQGEDGEEWVYLAVQVTDATYNSAAWYEIHLDTGDHAYQYRFDNGYSYLWGRDGPTPVDIPAGQIRAHFDELLEVLIPLALVSDPETVKVQGWVRYGSDGFSGLNNVDLTDWGSVSIQPQLFITDPLNPDTDGDGVGDAEDEQPVSITGIPTASLSAAPSGDLDLLMTCLNI